MARRDYERLQEAGVVFGDWKLLPCDGASGDNWELCHRHEARDTPRARKAGTAGQVQWNRLGRFYQYNTFGNALRYAADCELKAGAYGRVIELLDALHEYETITGALVADMARALGR